MIFLQNLRSDEATINLMLHSTPLNFPQLFTQLFTLSSIMLESLDNNNYSGGMLDL